MKKLISFLTIVMLLITVVPSTTVFSKAQNGIYNNGCGGIYIDINAEPFTSFANYSYGEYAYTRYGCAWFASARINQLTGRGNTIWDAYNWYYNAGPSMGFQRGKSPQAFSLACYKTDHGTYHCVIIEKIEGNTAYTSEGGYYSVGDSYGNCTISKRNVSELSQLYGYSLIGYVYFNNNVSVTPYKTSITSVNISGGNVTVSWNPVENASNYDIFIVEAPWGTENIIASVNTASLSHTFNISKGGNFCVFVAAKNSAGVAGESSEWYSFNIDASVPDAPYLNQNISGKDYYTSDTIKALWNPVSRAEEYEYYLIQYPTGYGYNTTKVKAGTVKDTYVSFKNLPIGRYSLFVHAKNNFGSSAQSNWVTFRVNPDDYIPTLVTCDNNHIYAVYDYSMNWDYAKKLCEYFGGHLATITSKEENELIISIIKSGKYDAYWLGGTDYKSGDYNTEHVPYYWINGENFSYTNWANGEPSRSGTEGNKEHFLAVRKSYDNKWNDESAINYNNKGFILEIEMEGNESENIRIANNKYIRFDKSMNWSEAEAYCNSLGGHLVTYTTKEEYDKVWNLINNGEKSWYYIGGQKLNGKWSWVTGDDIDWNSGFLEVPSVSDGYRLMQYHKKSENLVDKFAALKNSYPALEEIKQFGFICEIDNYYEDEINIDPSPDPTIIPNKEQRWTIDSYMNGIVKLSSPTDIINGEINYLYVAEYDSDGKLIDFELFNLVSEVEKTEYEIYTNKIINDNNVKIMLWNNNMQPLADIYER